MLYVRRGDEISDFSLSFYRKTYHPTSLIEISLCFSLTILIVQKILLSTKKEGLEGILKSVFIPLS
jgi:hypothetical protein